MTRQAAEYKLVFVDEVPPPLRAVRTAPAPAPAGTTDPPAERYIAPDSHRPHGSHAKYVVERCRCIPCTRGSGDYNARRSRAIRRPDEVWLPYIPAEPARAHLRQLAEAGVGLRSVARITGLSQSTLGKIVYGDPRRGTKPSRRIRPATSAKILAVTVGQVSGAQKIPAGPTWALLNDLIARGYTKQWLGRALGSKAKIPALQIAPDLVRASTARRVEDLHRRLAGRQGPGRRSRWDGR